MDYFLVILIVAAIAGIYWFFIGRDQAKSTRAESLHNQSSGIFDPAAAEALATIDNIAEPTSQDHLRRGNIRRYNIAEGNARVARNGQIPRVMDDYVAAIVCLDPADAGAMRIVDDVERFADQLLLDNLTTQDDAALWMINDFTRVVANVAPQTRAKTAANIKADAIAVSESREEAAATALDAATMYTRDPQNVHDSTLNSDLRANLRKLRADAGHINAESFQREIQDEIARDPARGKHARATFDRMMEGGRISTFDNEKESDILNYVWARSHHPQNRKRAGLIKEAIVGALADGVENGSVVCANGRASRVLNSLVSVDHDPELGEGGAMTYEAYKNQIFKEVKDVITREVDVAKDSSDPKMRNVAAMYAGQDVAVDLSTESRFNAGMRREITQQVEQYGDKLKPNEIEKIKDECFIYAMV